MKFPAKNGQRQTPTKYKNQNGDGLNVKVERQEIMTSKGSANLPSFITGHYGPNSSSSRAFESLVRAIGEAKSKQASLIACNCVVSFSSKSAIIILESNI